MVASTRVKAETPEVKPAPRAGGLGAGAAGSPAAGGAPTRKECREFEYRWNLRAPGRTSHILVDTREWKILEPVRRERSRTGTHGKDVYCLSEEEWNRVVVIGLERSNSGKLYYKVSVDKRGEHEKYALELVELLATCGDFEDMEETIRTWVEAKHLVSTTFGRGG